MDALSEKLEKCLKDVLCEIVTPTRISVEGKSHCKLDCDQRVAYFLVMVGVVHGLKNLPEKIALEVLDAFGTFILKGVIRQVLDIPTAITSVNEEHLGVDFDIENSWNCFEHEDDSSHTAADFETFNCSNFLFIMWHVCANCFAL
jgi:hypothetical protein